MLLSTAVTESVHVTRCPMRARVYLTLSPRDANLLGDGLEVLLDNTEYIERLGHENASQRLEKMMARLRELTDAHTPSLAEGMFDGPPDDYAG